MSLCTPIGPWHAHLHTVQKVKIVHFSYNRNIDPYRRADLGSRAKGSQVCFVPGGGGGSRGGGGRGYGHQNSPFFAGLHVHMDTWHA